MEERIARTIRNIRSIDDLAQFESNVSQRNALTDEIEDAIRVRSAELGRALIVERIGLDLTDLTPAEAKIVEAVSEYVGVMKRQGKDASRTFLQIKNRGLIDAAETAVARDQPTQGFQTLIEADRANLSYEQIVLDHPDEFSPRAIWYSRRTLGRPNDSDMPPANSISPTQTRTETLLRWLRGRSEANGGLLPSFTNAAAAAVLGMTDLHKFGRVFGNIQSRIDYACYVVGLPPLGLTADTPFDGAWNQQGRRWAFPVATMQAAAKSRVWSIQDFDLVLRETERLPAKAHILWKKDLTENEAKVHEWALGLEASNGSVVPAPGDEVETLPSEIPYWVFVCNPKKWAIDRFLERKIEHDKWGIRPSDREQFAPGQLGIVRVGKDRRTIAERNGKPPMEPGIYALCEVESEAFEGTGAGDEFWATGEEREPGWPTVKIRYLRTYLGNPLTIERLRTEKPHISGLVLNGLQAASFPIPANDFREVVELLGEELNELPSPPEEPEATTDKLTEIEQRYLRASPEVKERVSRTIERGPIGNLLKRATGFKCQICEALGHNPVGFLKPNGEPYVEAHHAMPVAKKEIGSLASSNVMILCANHHRQLHYGGIDVVIEAMTFDFTIDGTVIKIPRLSLAEEATE
jgi:hypothetical protein